MENNSYFTQQDINNITSFLLTIFSVILVIVVAINITGIAISHYFLKEEINEIMDEDFKVDLLQSLDSIKDVFLKRVLYHKEEDFFSDKKSYNKLIRYRIHDSCNLFPTSQVKKIVVEEGDYVAKQASDSKQ